MDSVSNPYSPGAGLRPPELAGREADITSFTTMVARAEAGRSSQSLVLTGLRGVGKTVLLNDLAERARTGDWIVAQVEARPDTDSTGSNFRAIVARSLNQSLRHVSGSWGVGDRLRAALATFKSFSIRTDPSGGLSLGIDIDAQRGRADSGSLEMDLSELAFDLGASASDRGTGVAVFVDEMQELSQNELAAICTAVHEAGQRSVPFYVIGAGLPSLPGLLAEARSYAERLFDYRPIGPLVGPDAEVAVVRPAELQGVSWQARAVQAVVEASAGYPYFVQEFANATWDYAPGPGVNAEDAILGIQAGREKLDSGFFASRWNRATPGERDYLRAMAPDGEGPSVSGEVARRLGKRTVQQVGPIRARLIHKGLVYAPEHGLVAYTVPGMADFINRQVD
ncbi:MAG TPA: ATP-binding protein [Acidimicrobiales bacterium]|nr:ATP-binding protein [Acidimicrobiales bacterium]